MATSKKKAATSKTKTSKTQTKGAAAPKKEVEILLVGSKVKQQIKDAGFNTGGDAIQGLNSWVTWLIKQATQRAQANGRKTVRAHDFMSL
jgi:histone H3/H4